MNTSKRKIGVEEAKPKGKLKNLTIREFAFSLVAAFDKFFFWLTKKGRTKIYIYELKKLISLVYNINYYFIVPIDRAPQCLYSQRHSYRWRNNILSFSIIFK